MQKSSRNAGFPQRPAQNFYQSSYLNQESPLKGKKYAEDYDQDVEVFEEEDGGIINIQSLNGGNTTGESTGHSTFLDDSV